MIFLSALHLCPDEAVILPYDRCLTHKNIQHKIIFGYKCGMQGNLAAVLLIRLQLFCISNISVWISAGGGV